MSNSRALEKLPSIIISSKLGTQTVNETTLCGSSLILSKSQNIKASTTRKRKWHQEAFIYELFNRGL